MSLTVGCFFSLIAIVLSAFRVVVAAFVPRWILRMMGKSDETKRPRRVAVIGAGIAGVGAAWALKKSGAISEVVLFEPRDVLGGNAKTFSWNVDGVPQPVRTGLSVLAWPKEYFKHYELLLKELQVETTEVTPKFYVTTEAELEAVFAQGDDHERWARDQQQWDRAVAAIRWINKLCFEATRVFKRVFRFVTFQSARGDGTWDRSGAAPSPSFYEVTMCNPMNVIPARWFCRVFFGVSDDFWNLVVVPIYSSSFLTVRLDALPCVILPPLDDIISVGDKDRLKKLQTWVGSSKDVFDRMAETISDKGAAHNILTGTEVLRVLRHGNAQWSVEYRAKSNAGWRAIIERHKMLQQKNGCAALDEVEMLSLSSHQEYFDAIVFACPATAVDALTDDPINRDAGFRSALFDAIVPKVRYENERDESFTTGYVHADRAAALPNEVLRSDFFARGFSNYIKVHGDPRHASMENTFVLGTWVPAAVNAAASVATDTSLVVEESQPAADERGEATNSKKGKRKHRGGKAASSSSSSATGAATELRATPTSNMEDGICNMMVTYNAVNEKLQRVTAAAVSTVDNSWAHPQFTMQSMGLSMALPLLQGRCDAYFCASYVTPGNGHDLSFLSGLAVAHRITGGYYPFSRTGNVGKSDAAASAAAVRDFALLRSLLFW